MMTDSVDRRRGSDAHDAAVDLKEVKVDRAGSESAMRVLNRVNAVFAEHKGMELLLVRNAVNTMDQARDLCTRVEAESVALRALNQQARQRFTKPRGATQALSRHKPVGEQTLPAPTNLRCNTTWGYDNKRPLSRDLAGMAIGQRLLRCGTPSKLAREIHADPNNSTAFAAQQRLKWDQMRNGQWRPQTPSVVPRLKMNPHGSMCLAMQLERFKGSEKLSETTFAGQLKSESEMLSHEEPDQSGKPPVACRAKYNRVVKNMLNQVELSPTRPKTSGRTSAMGLGGLGLGVVRDRSGQAAVKVHNAWITRFNSRPQTVPMR
eukprot:TRINITY_DN12918_c0_g1_i1.p1 TRINITY_DN12918_c0_g1~~TRINITY_DN12918_c0_g1_i1.p1  ORF type:complete len:320 (-),score=49.39 TRINITY_DN12918_c0_g1_i1:261-1220(-)